MSWNREDKHRRFARLAVCCMVVLWGGLPAHRLRAQDVLPPRPLPGVATAGAAYLDNKRLPDTVSVPEVVMPKAFRQLEENGLNDSLGILHPFWEKLRLARLGISTDTLRILHVGDSHVRGHIFRKPSAN